MTEEVANVSPRGTRSAEDSLVRRSVTPGVQPVVRANSFQSLNGPASNERKWIAESRWRTLIRFSNFKVPLSFDEASIRFSLNLPYFLTQYLVIGIFIVLFGALLSGGVAFILAVAIVVLLVIIVISITSKLDLSHSVRFIIFLFSCARLLITFFFL